MDLATAPSHDKISEDEELPSPLMSMSDIGGGVVAGGEDDSIPASFKGFLDDALAEADENLKASLFDLKGNYSIDDGVDDEDDTVEKSIMSHAVSDEMKKTHSEEAANLSRETDSAASSPVLRDSNTNAVSTDVSPPPDAMKVDERVNVTNRQNVDIFSPCSDVGGPFDTANVNSRPNPANDYVTEEAARKEAMDNDVDTLWSEVDKKMDSENGGLANELIPKSPELTSSLGLDNLVSDQFKSPTDSEFLPEPNTEVEMAPQASADPPSVGVEYSEFPPGTVDDSMDEENFLPNNSGRPTLMERQKQQGQTVRKEADSKSSVRKEASQPPVKGRSRLAGSSENIRKKRTSKTHVVRSGRTKPALIPHAQRSTGTSFVSKRVSTSQTTSSALKTRTSRTSRVGTTVTAKSRPGKENTNLKQRKPPLDDAVKAARERVKKAQAKANEAKKKHSLANTRTKAVPRVHPSIKAQSSAKKAIKSENSRTSIGSGVKPISATSRLHRETVSSGYRDKKKLQVVTSSAVRSETRPRKRINLAKTPPPAYVNKRIEEHKDRMRRASVVRQNQKEKPLPHTPAFSRRRRSSVPSKVVSNKKLTVPQPPKLATQSKMGDRIYSNSGKHDHLATNVNPISRALGEPTHPTNDEQGLSVQDNERPRLTEPQPFKLSEGKGSDAPASEVTQTMAEAINRYMSKGGLREIPPPTSRNEDGQPFVTEPKPFHLATMNLSPKRPLRKSFAQVEEEMMAEFESRPFRARPVFASAKKSASKPVSKKALTTPEPFRLQTEIRHSATPKALPLPTEEMRAAECSKQFRARPIGEGVIADVNHPGMGGDYGVPRVTKKQQTTPQPFMLKTEARHASAPPPPPTTDEILAQECEKQFHARPMPSSVTRHRREAIPSVVRTKVLTTPEPFKLRSSRRNTDSSKRPPPPPSTDEVELSRQFHARPLPSLAHQPIVNPRSRPVSTPKRTPQAPKLKTSERSNRRRAIEEASTKKADETRQQRRKLLEKKRREEHREMMLRSPAYATPVRKDPTQPVPFHLRSEERGEHYQLEMKEKIRKEEEELKKLADGFHANPIPESMHRPPSVPKNRGQEPELTAPEPFQLRSDLRHEIHHRELQERIMMEEEEIRNMAYYKARPLPVSTFKAPPTPTRSTRELVQPASPKLLLLSHDHGKARKELVEATRKRKEDEEAERKRIQEEREAEVEAQIQELRRLPIEEGGLIPRAKPVSSIFSEMRRLATPQSSLGSASDIGMGVGDGEHGSFRRRTTPLSGRRSYTPSSGVINSTPRSGMTVSVRRDLASLTEQFGAVKLG